MAAPLYEVYEESILTRLGVESRQRYPDFISRLETLSGTRIAFAQTGMLVANRSSADEVRSTGAAAWQSSAGLGSRILTQQDAESLQPGLAKARSWLWLPGEACFDSQRLGEVFASAVAGAGATLLIGEVREVCAIANRARAVRLMDGRRIDADAVVLAAGAWSSHLEGLPRPLPIEPVRGQIVRLRPENGTRLDVVVADHDGHYAVPRPDGTVVAGSTMERAGFDTDPTDSGRQGVREAVASLVPALREAEETESWAGLRPLCVDDQPIVGPEPLLDGLFYATGFGRRGMLIGPLVGSLVADMVLERDIPFDIRGFAADRFTPVA